MESRLVPAKLQIPLIIIFALVILAIPPAILAFSPPLPAAPPPVSVPGLGDSWDPMMTHPSGKGFLIAAGVLIAFGILVLVAPVWLLVRRKPARPVPDPPPWGIVDLLAVFILALTVGFAASPVLGVGDQLDVATLLGDSIVKGIAVLILLAWLHHRRGATAADLGLHSKGIIASIPWGAYLYVSSVPAYLGAAFVSLAVHAATGAAPEAHPVHSLILGEEATPGSRVAVVILATVMAPLFEEIFFRGFLFTTLRRYIGPGLAILSSAAIFAALHPLSGFYPILVLGVVFAFLYERTGNLFAPMVLHMVHNGAALAILILVGSDPSAPLPW